MKKIFFSTLGCAKNLVDSEMMAGSLEQAGYKITDEVSLADIAIINTCGFIESAKEESINEILYIASKKNGGKLSKLVVTGCLAQRYSEELIKEIPEIDLLLGTTSFDNIVNEIEKPNANNKILIESINKQILDLPRRIFTQKYSSYLKIAEGCDNLCTYCIIPKLRGKYRSREMENIVNEAKDLVKNGTKELILIAQDTSKYGIDLYNEKKLPELLIELDKIEGLEWIRLLYLYPEDIDERLLDTIKKSNRIVPYFDMPIQHSSDKILKYMNRHTNKAELKEKINLIRRYLPEATIRTTLIVGFPNETEEDFKELLDFVEEIKFDRLGVFEYSKEEGTPAAKMKNQVEDNIKRIRRNKIMEEQQIISLNTNKSFLGKKLKVLIEREEDANIYSGRSYRDMIEIDGLVYVNSTKKLKRGDFVEVVINDAMEYDLLGDYYEFSK